MPKGWVFQDMVDRLRQSRAVELLLRKNSRAARSFVMTGVDCLMVSGRGRERNDQCRQLPQGRFRQRAGSRPANQEIGFLVCGCHVFNESRCQDMRPFGQIGCQVLIASPGLHNESIRNLPLVQLLGGVQHECDQGPCSLAATQEQNAGRFTQLRLPGPTLGWLRLGSDRHAGDYGSRTGQMGMAFFERRADGGGVAREVPGNNSRIAVLFVEDDRPA